MAQHSASGKLISEVVLRWSSPRVGAWDSESDPAQIWILPIFDLARHATWPGDNAGDGSVPQPVRLWQQAVHVPGIYDLEVDTSVLSPEACADVIQRYLNDGSPAWAFRQLATLAAV